jgi:hypothetical protein
VVNASQPLEPSLELALLGVAEEDAWSLLNRTVDVPARSTSHHSRAVSEPDH